MNFQRNQDPKKVLEIGNIAYYKDMWFSKMRPLYDNIRSWAGSRNLSYNFGQMNFDTGIFYFYDLGFDQKKRIVYSIKLEILIEHLDNFIKSIERQQQVYENQVYENDKIPVYNCTNVQMKNNTII